MRPDVIRPVVERTRINGPELVFCSFFSLKSIKGLSLNGLYEPPFVQSSYQDLSCRWLIETVIILSNHIDFSYQELHTPLFISSRSSVLASLIEIPYIQDESVRELRPINHHTIDCQVQLQPTFSQSWGLEYTFRGKTREQENNNRKRTRNLQQTCWTHFLILSMGPTISGLKWKMFARIEYKI